MKNVERDKARVQADDREAAGHEAAAELSPETAIEALEAAGRGMSESARAETEAFVDETAEQVGRFEVRHGGLNVTEIEATRRIIAGAEAARDALDLKATNTLEAGAPAPETAEQRRGRLERGMAEVIASEGRLKTTVSVLERLLELQGGGAEDGGEPQTEAGLWLQRARGNLVEIQEIRSNLAKKMETSPDEVQEEDFEMGAEIRAYEYRDTEGRAIGMGVLELSRAKDLVLQGGDGERFATADGRPAKRREVEKFIMFGEKGGQQTRVDMMDLANPHDARVFVMSENFTRYSHVKVGPDEDAPPRSVVFVPAPETAADIGVMLHELGHAKQNNETHLEALNPLYGQKVEMSALEPDRIDYEHTRKKLARTIDALGRTVPGAAEFFRETEEFQQLERLSDRILDLEREASDLRESYYVLDMQIRVLTSERESLIASGEAGKVDRAKLEERLKELGARVAELKSKRQGKLDDADRLRGAQHDLMDQVIDMEAVIGAPKKMLERNATKEALTWMRKLRNQFGIDLLARSVFPTRALRFGGRPPGDCEDSIRRGFRREEAGDGGVETSTQDDLKLALWTYGAARGNPLLAIDRSGRKKPARPKRRSK
jgi:hypothetical protein